MLRQTATIALAGFAEEDQISLKRIFECSALVPDCKLAIQPGVNVEATVKAVQRNRIPVVLCDRDRHRDFWKNLLERFGGLSVAPCLIVTSRLADERLWAEALNLGAYDVLARPFESAEVVRSVSLAKLHWQHMCATSRHL